MRQVKVSLQLFAMQFVGINPIECRVLDVKWRSGKLLLPKDHAAVDIVEQLVVSLRLVWESAVIKKHVPSAFRS